MKYVLAFFRVTNDESGIRCSALSFNKGFLKTYVAEVLAYISELPMMSLALGAQL